MRNREASEVRDLKDLPVTNVLLDPSERCSRDGSLWFLHRPQNENREGPGLSVLSKIPSEREKALSVGTAVRHRQTLTTISWNHHLSCHSGQEVFNTNVETYSGKGVEVLHLQRTVS